MRLPGPLSQFFRPHSFPQTKGEKARDQLPRGLVLREMPVATYVVGDVHGCLSLYRRLEDRLVDDGRRFDGPKLIVLLGDLIDRGPDSAGMLDHVSKPPPDGFDRLCLLGNHEDLMLRFLDDPARHGAWLDYGGQETLMSYGIGPDPDRGWDIAARTMRFLIQTHVPVDHLRFLQSLPLFVSLGNYFLVHAGIDPGKPLDRQRRHDLIWMRPTQGADACQVPKIVVHGHTPVDTAGEVGWRIAVDTGAYHSGLLSAVKLTPNHPPSFFAVSR